MPSPSARNAGASLVLVVAAAMLVPVLPAGAAASGCTIKGTPGNDRLVGTKKDDVICGLGGKDVLLGRGGDDKLLGGGGRDTLKSGGGRDQLLGQGGNDVLLGGGGSDRLAGGSGGDRLDGGGAADRLAGNGGRDIASYATRRTGVTIALDGSPTSGAAGEGDRVATDVETALGGPGDDLLSGSPAAQTFRGGAGSDTVSYAARVEPVVVTLDGTATSGQVDEGDRVGGDVEAAVGGAGDDTLTGGPGADELEGLGGNDTLVGDTVTGVFRARTAVGAGLEGGGDTLSGGDGADVLIGGEGSDVLDGGGGVDTVSYADQSAPVTADLDGEPGDGVAGEGDTIGTDVENLTGGGGADTLTGDGDLNILDGGAGDDLLVGGAGGDALDGGGGVDTVSYADQSAPVTADLDGEPGDGVAGEGDTVGTDVENLTGGGGADTLTGDGDPNTLDGGAGADVLAGGAEGDVLDAGSGTGDLTDGGSGADVCVASDEMIEDVPNCEPLAGGSFGVYNLVSLDPPPEADAQPGLPDDSRVPVVADTLSTGEVIVAVASESGDPSVTKLDETGAIDPTFGQDGWVYGLPAQIGMGLGRLMSLEVVDDHIYLGVLGQDSYLVKLDGNGIPQTDWGNGGFLAFSDALGPDACPVACGNTGFKVTQAGISAGYNDFDPDASSNQFTAGVVRFSFADGSPVSATQFEETLVDGDLPSDMLATPDGAALTVSRQGNVRRYLADGGRDHDFAGDGLLEPDPGLLGEGQGVTRPQLVLSTAGFTRLGIGGTVAPADGTGVPKLVATEPQVAVVEHFALDGTPVSLPGDSWSSTTVDLPAEPEECDAPAAGSHSFVTNAMRSEFSSSLLPVRRCTDALWLTLDAAGDGSLLQRSGPNMTRDADLVTVAAGTLLGYASARGIVSIELVTGG